jgi:hypothetical protein
VPGWRGCPRAAPPASAAGGAPCWPLICAGGGKSTAQPARTHCVTACAARARGAASVAAAFKPRTAAAAACVCQPSAPAFNPRAAPPPRGALRGAGSGSRLRDTSLSVRRLRTGTAHARGRGPAVVIRGRGPPACRRGVASPPPRAPYRGRCCLRSVAKGHHSCGR